MSIVVAIKKGRQTIIASDSLSVFGSHCEDERNIVNKEKILAIGSSWMGYTGWGLYGNILDHYLQGRKTAPRLGSELQIFDFFLKLLRALRDKYSLVNEQSNSDRDPFADLDSSFLIVNRKGIFHVSSNLSVSRFGCYYAIGSGCEYATGAMHALYDSDLTATEIARKAVEAAIRFDTDCGGEIAIKRVK